MSDSGELQDNDSKYSGIFSHVPRQPAVVPSPRPMLSGDRSMEFVWDTGKRFWQSTFCVRFVTDILSRNSSLYESKCHRCNPDAGEHRDICRER